MTAVGDAGGADRVWPWAALTAGTLAPDEECPGVPSQILQGQGRHCPRPAAEPGPQEPHRVRTWPWWWAAVTAASQACDVRGCHQPGPA